MPLSIEGRQKDRQRGLFLQTTYGRRYEARSIEPGFLSVNTVSTGCLAQTRAPTYTRANVYLLTGEHDASYKAINKKQISTRRRRSRSRVFDWPIFG